MTVQEPEKPARGLTAEELGPDVSEAQAQADAQPTMSRRMLAAMKPSYTLSMAEGYPVGIKQFLQFCLILVYPAFLFMIILSWALYGVFWLLFAPLRLWMKKNRPEDYAASQLK